MTVVDWPSQSPDLNLIKNLRDEVERPLGQLAVRITTAGALFPHLQQTWSDITADVCEHVVRAMAGRVRQVVANNGDATSY